MAPPVEENPPAANEGAPSETPPHTKPNNAEESNVVTDEGKSTPKDGDFKEAAKEEASHESDASRAETPHDESDFEDNITVTVPKPQTHTNNYHDYRDRQSMNGRYNRSSNVNEVEASPSQQQSHQVSKYTKSLNQFKFWQDISIAIPCNTINCTQQNEFIIIYINVKKFVHLV